MKDLEKDPMETEDGTANLRLSRLGLGTAQLGNLYRVTTDFEVQETLDAAWDSGIRYFDTAPHYGLGLSEQRLGEWLYSKPREQYLISTKVGRLLEPNLQNPNSRDTEGFDVPATYVRKWDFSRDGILRSVEDSLRRTGLDSFDILYLHDPEHHFEQASTEGIGALIELREQGVVKAVGAGMNFSGPLTELIRRADVDLVMCAGRFSLLDSDALKELLPLASARNVGVVAAGVFNSGLLSRPNPPTDAKFNYEQAPQALIDRARKIAEACDQVGVTLPEVAMRYVLKHPAVASVVVGARGKKQVVENVIRSKAQIPDALWSDLAAQGLIERF